MDDFETLLLANKLGVERWVKFHISGPDAEDVLQETYLAAYQAFPRLKDTAAFRPWLLSIARNKWRDWYRKQARRPDTPVGELPDVASEEEPDTAVVGRCDLTLDGRTTDCIAVMDLSAYMEGVVSLQFIDRDGRTLLWQRYNRDDWELVRYGKRWSELLPDNDRITVDGVTYVHWYDCYYLR